MEVSWAVLKWPCLCLIILQSSRGYLKSEQFQWYLLVEKWDLTILCCFKQTAQLQIARVAETTCQQGHMCLKNAFQHPGSLHSGPASREGHLHFKLPTCGFKRVFAPAGTVPTSANSPVGSRLGQHSLWTSGENHHSFLFILWKQLLY